MLFRLKDTSHIDWYSNVARLMEAQIDVTIYHMMSQDVSKCHKMSQDFTRCHKISQDVTRFHKMSWVTYLDHHWRCVQKLRNPLSPDFQAKHLWLLTQSKRLSIRHQLILSTESCSICSDIPSWILVMMIVTL